MTKLIDLTSLSQLLITLNLAAPAIFKVVEQTRTSVTNAVVELTCAGHPDLSVSQRDRQDMQRYVTLYFPWLRRIFKVANMLVLGSIVVSSLCFCLLVWETLRPDYLASDAVIIGYALTGVVLPILYFFLERMLSFFDKTLVDRLRTDHELRARVSGYFFDFIKRHQEWGVLDRKFDRILEARNALQGTL